LRSSKRFFDSNGPQERIETVADVLIQAIELAAFLFGQNVITAEWR